MTLSPAVKHLLRYVALAYLIFLLVVPVGLVSIGATDVCHSARSGLCLYLDQTRAPSTFQSG